MSLSGIVPNKFSHFFISVSHFLLVVVRLLLLEDLPSFKKVAK